MYHDGSDRALESGGDRANALLREAIDSLECSYALFDAARRLLDYNRSYFALHQPTFAAFGVTSYDGTPSPDSRAITYNDLMLGAIRRVLPHASPADTTAELARRMELHDSASELQDFERLQPGARWIRVAKRRLAGGEVAGISLDITGLKEREFAITAREEEYRALLETSPVGIWYLDEDGRTLFSNTRLAGLYGGTTPASLSDAPLHRVDTQAGMGPFGFPPGREVEALIPAAGRRSRANVLVCASGWFARGADGTRGAVLTLLDITPLKAAQTRAEHLARHDTLTGLANRAQFRQVLDNALEVGEPIALMLVDLDRFKEANDRFGHAAGDAVLCEAAMRLRGAALSDDLVCRMGGDEFAILLCGHDAPGRVAPMAAALAAIMPNPARAGQQNVAMSASIGHASWPADAPDAEQLQRAADLALYAAKNAGRSRAVAFTPVLLQVRERSAQLGAALAQVIHEGRLTLVWQPQVRIPGNSLRSAEALVRWPDSPFSGQEALPGEFLPIAQEAGLMAALDSWVLDAALRQARDWAGLPGAPGRVAVNISQGALTDQTLPARIAAMLLRYGLSPDVLEIEVPESLAARDLDDATPVLADLSEMGVGLALDDFGGGLSSLSHLVRLPVSLLKLDRSIVAGLPGDRERTLLRAVMSLADGLSIPVLAEGIETEAQAFALRREGCTLMQGYLFGRPVPADVLVPPRREALFA